MDRVVVAFAKVPGPGNPKSRIADVAGKDRAEAIYAELLRSTSKAIEGFDCIVSYTGSATPGVLKRFFPRARKFIPQKEESLGERVRHALIAAREEGYTLLVAIGMDCPEMMLSDIMEAFKRLENGTDVVLGPAEDGGYYLIAVKEPDCGIFSVEGWGTDSLLEKTLEKIEDLGLSHSLLDRKEDIDTLEDYEAWKSRVREAAGEL